ncbi:MAG: YigZ family protein [Clostridia bacterium]|nr:YigZ family protein [Clostridia bacterium]
MGLKSYKTLLKRGDDEFIVNKSVFIGHGTPVHSEEEATAFIAKMRKAYADASHNCYAYIIGPNMGIMRYSDDGEPGGTAGMPIIEVMKNRAVTDACVVVTRYFGGVLLGAGGLVRAYTRGAVCAIDAAGVGTMYPTVRYMAEIPYPMLNRLDHYLKRAPIIEEERTFADTVTLTFLIRTTDEEQLLSDLTQLSDGQLEPLRFDELFWPWPEND